MRFVDAVFEALGASVVTQEDYQPDNVLSMLLGVDGAGSGLDADFLQGNIPSAFELAGTVVGAISAHEAALDPHAQYETQARADARYQPLDTDLTALAALTDIGGYAKRTAAGTWSIVTPSAVDVGADVDGAAAGAVSDHVAALDPHTQYETQGRADTRYSQLGHDHAGVYQPVFVGSVVTASVYAVEFTDIYVLFDTTNGAIVATLPVASGHDNSRILLSNIGSGILTIAPNGSELLDGSNTSFDLYCGEVLDVISFGGQWRIV